MHRGLVLLLALAAIAAAHAESLSDRWNLADVYPSLEAWNADAAKLDAQLKEFGGCKGRLGASAARLRQCLDLRADMTKRFYRLALYAGQQLAEDTGSAPFLELDQRSDLLENRLREATAFVDPEILRLGKDRVDAFLAQESALAIYRHPLDRILRAAPHTLDDAGEALVAKFGMIDGTGGSTYSILTNADIPWPKVKLSTGEEFTLDASAYTK